MKAFVKILFISPLLLLTACAQNTLTFDASKAKPSVERGSGGEYEIVDGVEVWTSGAPDKEYKVLGEILDTRKGGLIYKMGMSSGVVKKAQEVGGDALIEKSSFVRGVGPVTKTMTWNVLSSGAGYPTYSSSQKTKRESRFFVIKYVDRGED